MFSVKYPSTRRSLLFIVVGLIVFILYLYFFVGVQELFYALHRVNTTEYVFFYGLAIGCGLFALLSWTAAWKNALRMFSVELGTRTAFMYFWVGYFLDLLVPSAALGGELVRLYLVQNKTKQDSGAIAASAIVNRMVEYAIVAVGLSSSVLTVFLLFTLPTILSNFLLLVLVGTLVYLAILLFLAFKKRSGELLVAFGLKLAKFLRVKRFNSPKTVENTRASLARFYQTFEIVKQKPRRLVLTLGFQLLSFLLNFFMYVAVFEALGFQNISFGFLVLVVFIASSIQGATGSLSVGSLDIILVTIFTLYGMSLADSGIAVVVLRSVTYWIPLLIGYAVVQLVGARGLRLTKS